MSGDTERKTKASSHPGEIEKLSGRIERITYANEENGYTVLTVKAPGRKALVTAVGHLANPRPGEFIEMEGAFIVNPDYGLQFKVAKHHLAPPNTETSLKKYLGSGLIKGVGPVLAGRLVDHFGDKTLDILDKTPERLTEVPGLGAGRREMIIESWRRAAGLKRLLTFLAEFGLGPAVAMRVMRQLGDEADALIRQDPYRLAYEISGIGFVTADKVARTLGLAADAPQRLEAGLLFVLNQAADEGHVFWPDHQLLKDAAALIPEAARPDLEAALGRLVLEGRVKSEIQEEPGGLDLYLPRLHRAENWVARDLLSILHTRPALEIPRQEKALDWAVTTLGLDLSPSQREAARLALEAKLLVITGGPGTGKTTITRIITAIYGAVHARVGLVAPTGRAAKRLSEATGLLAKTVHRLLEYSPQAGGFMRGPNNKLDLDLLLVDEASMVDLALMNQLTGALPHRARLILVGDQDQLPPVGPGRVLADLMESGVAAVARLTEIHRQAESSQIIKAAHQINQGRFPESSADRDNGDFYFIESRDPKKILDQIIYLVTRKIPAKLGLNPLDDIQVLTPMHNRELGTEALNQVLGEKLNHSAGPPLIRLGRRFRQGDRVMQLRNNYNREVFNGDHGRIEKIDLEAQEVTVSFDGRPVIYDFADLDELSLAYAITIHKSQGSEFPVVIIPVTTGHHIMLRRKLLYTAVTRGRRFVVLIGSAEALQRAVSSDREQARNSRLALKLAGRLKV
ncbi:ATP-dependent RecD-like DNA helicase [Deltaproteobacteria bacterium OttesenSCG-928-M10]|nr:ATP-dependent RecD-like DNA helicase [Deltaproteobacteria bacterium OttesenSCG-928-M10]